MLADAILIPPRPPIKKKVRGQQKSTRDFLHDLRAKMLTKYISIGGYSPGVRAFGTQSSKAVRLIICKTI